MFTSRAEYRLSLREDNADERLTAIGHELGVVGDERWQIFAAKRERIALEQQRLASITVHPKHLSSGQIETLGGELSREQKALELLRRPEVGHALLESIETVGMRPRPADETAEQGGATRGGGGGGKGPDQGEREPAKHAPDTEPAKWRAQCAGPRATGCSQEQERAIQRALPPHHHRAP